MSSSHIQSTHKYSNKKQEISGEMQEETWYQWYSISSDTSKLAPHK